MKTEVHPDYHPVIFKDGEHEIVTRSTATSDRTREVDGVEHYVISVDISAFSHPFYTGQKKLVDTEGRVDRFFNRYDLEKPDEEIGEDLEDESEQQAEDEAPVEEESEDEEPEAEEAAEVEDEEDGDDD